MLEFRFSILLLVGSTLQSGHAFVYPPSKRRLPIPITLRSPLSSINAGGAVEEQIDPEDTSALLLADVDGTNNNVNGGNAIELQTEVSRSFLQYSLSIILGRALPDARDGLKPVHRRILYAMSQLGLNSGSPHRKCARVVGEVLGKLHPHGDQAVYDALVRMAQDFNSHYPLIDGHGNFGSMDADPAAAMRYTECRLTPLSQTSMLSDLDPAIIPYLPNFDGTESEPTVLPAKLPMLLLNGSSGIAVGMATNIPPHNLHEVLTACSALLEARMGKRDAVTDEQLLEMIPAPDFPTGALILQTNGSKNLYQTGNGGIVLRAVTSVEKVVTGKRHRTAIVVTELPYQTNKAALLEKIATLVNDKKLEGIADLRDESDRDGIRIVLELKRDAVAAVVLNNLFKKTALQSTFNGNFVALLKAGGSDDASSSGGSSLDATATSLVPQRLTLRAALDCFLDFRFDTIRNKSQMELKQVQARVHIVEGLLLALTDIDQVIDTIRNASDSAAAKTDLQQLLQASIEQAEAILRLQLGQLTRLNKGKLEEELETLQKSEERLQKLLKNDNAVYKLIQKESQELDDKFGTERKSRIVLEEDGELNDIDLIRNSRSVIVTTRGGYIKRMPLKVFETQGRRTRGKRGTSDAGGDSDDNEVAQCFTCNDHDTLLMVTQRGIAYGLRAYQVPTGGRTAKGQPIPSVLPIRNSDVITAILPVSEFSDNRFLVLATESGWIKKTPLKAFENLTSRGLTIASLQEEDRLNWCQLCQDGDDILIGSAMGKATRFESAKLRPTGRTSRGVRSMKLREGDAVADMNVLSGSDSSSEQEYVLAVTSDGFGKRISTTEFRAQARGGVGVIAMKFKKDDDRMSCLHIVQDDDEVLVITARGIIVRQKVSEISIQSRAATGVLVQRVDDGDSISSVSIVPKYEERDEA